MHHWVVRDGQSFAGQRNISSITPAYLNSDIVENHFVNIEAHAMA